MSTFYAQYPSPGGAGGGTDVNIHDAAGTNILLGQGLMAASLPVVIASDQSALPVSAGSLPLPSGAATSAKQDTGNTSLASIDGKITACNTGAVVVSSSALPSGASTAAKQDTGNTSLASIDGKITACNTGAVVVSSSALPTGAATETTLAAASAKLPATLGQKAMTASMAVVIASDQSSIGTKSPVNTNGAITNQALTATTASSTSAPANAVGFVIQAPSTNTDNIRWCVGGTASTTVGMLMEPGRDSGFYPMAATISVCATVSGTNVYSIQWVLSS